MKKYSVTVTYNADMTLDVEAEGEEQARDIAFKKIANMTDKEYVGHLNIEIDNIDTVENDLT